MSEHPLDGRAARVVALVLAVGFFAAPVLIYWDDLFGAATVADAPDGNPEFTACVAERRVPVDAMLADGVVDQERHALFLSRAVAMCRAEFPQ